MKHPADFTPAFPAVVDNTMRSAFVSCPQKFFQEFLLCRSPLGGASVHLIAGATYARGLEFVREKVWGPDQWSLDEALAGMVPVVYAEYGDFACPPDYQHKSVQRVLQAIVAYFDRFPPESDHILPYIKSNKKPAVEFNFSFPTQIKHPDSGEPIIYCGRFDMIGVYNDLLWVVDDKTATQLGSSWDKSWRLKAQLTGYVFAARQYGFPVEGAIVRGCSFLKTGAYGFSEPILYKGDWNVERWWIQLHRDLARMVQCWQDRDNDFPLGYWDFNFDHSCSTFGQACPFTNLCDVKNPEEWAKTDFEYRKWNPMELLPVEVEDDQRELAELKT